jgi:hypothetical protein
MAKVVRIWYHCMTPENEEEEGLNIVYTFNNKLFEIVANDYFEVVNKGRNCDIGENILTKSAFERMQQKVSQRGTDTYSPFKYNDSLLIYINHEVVAYKESDSVNPTDVETNLLG